VRAAGVGLEGGVVLEEADGRRAAGGGLQEGGDILGRALGLVPELAGDLGGGEFEPAASGRRGERFAHRTLMEGFHEFPVGGAGRGMAC